MWRTTTSPARIRSSASSSAPGRSSAALDRLELRIERLQLTFRFTYAFHAREVRFERDLGNGFERVFPETFSFHADRHDPAEIYLQFDDLARKPRFLSPRATRRDADVLLSRLVLGVPRYLEGVVARLEADERLGPDALTKVHEDVALLSQILLRFVSDKGGEDRPGIRAAGFHLRKLAFRSLLALMRRRVAPEYLERYVEGSVDPVNPADDLSEAGFFHTMEGDDPDAVNRSVVRLAERAFYRWIEDVCLDESNRAFELEDSPFEDRETEVLNAIGEHGSHLQRARDLVPFLRRPDNRDCMRVLEKLEAWFLRQYDIHDAAVMIHHADNLQRGEVVPDRVLSRHSGRNYLALIALLMTPFAVATFAYSRAPEIFDIVCSAELLCVYAAVVWFMLYRFCWKRDLTLFRASVPRIAAGIIVGYLPIFFLDEVWALAARGWFTLASVAFLMGFATLLYLYIEVQRRLGDPTEAFSRARTIFLLGVLQAIGIGLLITGLVGSFMATRNWLDDGTVASTAALRQLPPLVGELPRVLGLEPFFAFPSAIFLMTFLSFFIGTFLQLMWEDIPITEPL
jgi:hypothetical protein